MSEQNYNVVKPPDRGLIKAWTKGVQVESSAQAQLENVAILPFVRPWVAAMPDVHWGMGATVGSVIPTENAIIPAAVGVDIGCGMNWQRTDLRAEDLPTSLSKLRSSIEEAIPVGGPGIKGSWAEDGRNLAPQEVSIAWMSFADEYYQEITAKHQKIARGATVEQLGTLGTGNHFIEICLDEEGFVSVMLHSGSRGLGNRIGTYFIEKAKEEMRRWFIDLPDENLAYLPQGSQYFADYVRAVNFAQRFAFENRRLMMRQVLKCLRDVTRKFELTEDAVNCHHNYVASEEHFGKKVWITRKGAVRAGKGDLGIIPGSMGAKSYIVRGLGNPDSFMSCSHGAGRAMSRTEARKRFTLKDHREATEGVECRKDKEVIDETPGAYKPIDDVMNAQKDLVEVVHTLKQVVCIKG